MFIHSPEEKKKKCILQYSYLYPAASRHFIFWHFNRRKLRRRFSFPSLWDLNHWIISSRQADMCAKVGASLTCFLNFCFFSVFCNSSGKKLTLDTKVMLLLIYWQHLRYIFSTIKKLILIVICWHTCLKFSKEGSMSAWIPSPKKEIKKKKEVSLMKVLFMCHNNGNHFLCNSTILLKAWVFCLLGRFFWSYIWPKEMECDSSNRKVCGGVTTPPVHQVAVLVFWLLLCRWSLRRRTWVHSKNI